MRVVVHEPTLTADGAERIGAIVLAAVRSAVRGELSRLEGAEAAADDRADGGPDDTGDVGQAVTPR